MEQGIFSISFKPQVVARILQNNQAHGHHLALIRSDTDNLIEISTTDARNSLERPIHFSKEEFARIGFSKPVPGTRWYLVNICNENLFAKNRRQEIIQVAVALSGFLKISAILVILVRREERLHRAAEQDLLATKNSAIDASIAKSDFLSHMSHEIRTPLTTLIGFSETLLDPKLSEDNHNRIIRTIVRSGHHLLALINDILDISKIESGNLVLEKLSFSPTELLLDVESIIGFKARKKGLEFSIEYAFPIPSRVESDPTRVKQVLPNLCGNAVKFTEQGSIRIRLSCDTFHRRMTARAINTGIGMSETEIQQIFTPFKQANTSTTRKYGGTGLGLSISRNLAEMLGGSLSCKSEPGTGSEFVFYFDTGDLSETQLMRSDYDVYLIRDQHDRHNKPPKLQGRILLAEDNPDIQDLISLHIIKTGAQVSIAGNGE